MQKKWVRKGKETLKKLETAEHLAYVLLTHVSMDIALLWIAGTNFAMKQPAHKQICSATEADAGGADDEAGGWVRRQGDDRDR